MQIRTDNSLLLAVLKIDSSLEGPDAVRDPDPELRLVVVPVALADVPRRVAPEGIRQAFFGGPEYRMTPAPNAQLTSGSVAELVAWVSGGVSGLSGSMSDPVDCEVLAVDARVDPQLAVRELIGELDLRAELAQEGLDAIVVVYGGGALPGLLDGGSVRVDRSGTPTEGGQGTPVVFLPEESADGSIVASGRALWAVLRALYGLEPLDSAENGDFGLLALSAQGRGHIPTSPAGINLIHTGWADMLTVDASRGERQAISISPLLLGHVVYRMPSGLIDRGDLILEARGGSLTEPSLGPSGIMLYWQFHSARPTIVIADGRSCEPRLLRLSPVTSIVDAPFTPGTPADLLRTASRLDGASVPSLATPQGEVLWELQDLRAVDSEAMSMELSYLGEDLLSSPGVPWSTGRDGRFGPLPADGIDRGVGAVEATDGGFELHTRPGKGTALRAEFTVPAATFPRRLFGRFDGLVGNGQAILTVALDGERIVTAEVDPARGRAIFQAELSPMFRTRRLTWELTTRRGRIGGRLDQLLLVPTARVLHDIRLSDRSAGSVRLMDGVDYSRTHPIVVGDDGRTEVSIPVVLPAGKVGLRLHAGLRADRAPEAVRLSAVLRAHDGSSRAVVVDSMTITSGETPNPLSIVFAELPAHDQERIAFLDLIVEGEHHQELHIVSAAIARP